MNKILVDVELLIRAANSIENHHNSRAWEISSELRALLAQPADQQGEPMAVAAVTSRTDHFEDGELVRVNVEITAVDRRSDLTCGEFLYRHAQPATAKVVLPERLDLPHRDEFESADQNAAAVGEAKNWNACLDEVAKLNGGQS